MKGQNTFLQKRNDEYADNRTANGRQTARHGSSAHNASEQGWFRNLVKVGNFPVGLVVFLVFAVICSIILNKTKAGRYISEAP